MNRRELLRLAAAQATLLAGASSSAHPVPPAPSPQDPVARAPVGASRGCDLVARAITIRLVHAGESVNDARVTLLERGSGRELRRVDGAALGEGRYVLFDGEDRPDAALPGDAYAVRIAWRGRERRVTLHFAVADGGGCQVLRLERPTLVTLD